jgi:hypothetical protein
MELTERITDTLKNLPRSPLLARTTVVDAFLDLMIGTEDAEERQRLEESLTRLPRSVVLDRTTVADALLDVLPPGDPSLN